MKTYVLTEGDCTAQDIKVVMQGPEDFDVDLEFKVWYNANMLEVIGPNPLEFGLISNSEIRLEWEAWRDLYKEVQASLSMLALGRPDGSWNEIFAVHLVENHGFEKLEFETKEFYPEA